MHLFFLIPSASMKEKKAIFCRAIMRQVLQSERALSLHSCVWLWDPEGGMEYGTVCFVFFSPPSQSTLPIVIITISSCTSAIFPFAWTAFHQSLLLMLGSLELSSPRLTSSLSHYWVRPGCTDNRHIGVMHNNNICPKTFNVYFWHSWSIGLLEIWQYA